MAKNTKNPMPLSKETMGLFKHVSLLGIKLRANESQLDFGNEESFQSSSDVIVSYEGKAVQLNDIIHAECFFQFEMRNQDKNIALVSINTVYMLGYKLPKEMNVSQDALDEFANLNAVYNAWPYWRAWLAHVLNEMGVQRCTLPTFRPGMPKEMKIGTFVLDLGTPFHEPLNSL